LLVVQPSYIFFSAAHYRYAAAPAIFSMQVWDDSGALPIASNLLLFLPVLIPLSLLLLLQLGLYN